VNPAVFLEVFSSLTIQVTLMTAIVLWTARHQWEGMGSDKTWKLLHAFILLMTVAAVVFPHLRPVTLADFDLGQRLPAWHATCNTIGRICFWIWLTGALAMTVALVGGIWKAAYLVRHTEASADLTSLASQVFDGKQRPAKPIEVRVSSISVSPFCWQFHRPVIVVPDLLLDFSPTEQQAVFKHELAHLQAQHPLGLFLQRLVEVIYWFHPLVWYASRRAAGAREFRCDRSVVQSRQDLANYLRSMLRLIESQTSPPSRLPAGLGFLGDSKLLCKRADVLVAWVEKRTDSSLQRKAAIAVLTAAGLCMFLWVPLNPLASRRSWWSPWPACSANALDATGIRVRDYEIDGHRLQPHEFRS
jgi:bla regulator protein blaR1